MTEQEHQFCNCSLECAVVATHNAGLKQLDTSLITVHLNVSSKALADVYHDDSVVHGIFQAINKPFFLRSIARAERAQNDGMNRIARNNLSDDVFLNSREKRKHNYV